MTTFILLMTLYLWAKSCFIKFRVDDLECNLALERKRVARLEEASDADR